MPDVSAGPVVFAGGLFEFVGLAAPVVTSPAPVCVLLDVSVVGNERIGGAVAVAPMPLRTAEAGCTNVVAASALETKSAEAFPDFTMLIPLCAEQVRFVVSESHE